jgi:hypothetical protein
MRMTARIIGLGVALGLLAGCASSPAESWAAAQRGAAQAAFWHTSPAYFWPYPAAEPLGGAG